MKYIAIIFIAFFALACNNQSSKSSLYEDDELPELSEERFEKIKKRVLADTAFVNRLNQEANNTNNRKGQNLILLLNNSYEDRCKITGLSPLEVEIEFYKLELAMNMMDKLKAQQKKNLDSLRR